MDISAQTAWQEFLTASLQETLARHRVTSPADTALALFHRCAQDVPAYREFLGARGIDPSSIRTCADFARAPLVTKQNYMRAYDLPARCRGGDLAACEMVAVSSGSTGDPMFWPRAMADELEIASRFEQVFRDAFRAHERRTLAVICFTMGTWVGGMYTAQCCRYLAQKGYHITVVTPGNNKAEIYKAVSQLGPYYDQVVLLGYPPFIKDVVDTGIAQQIDWARFRIKMVYAGEVFSEEWRALVCQRTGASDPIRDTASLYGTADAGVLGNETPLSITIRRWFSAHPQIAREFFGESRLPSLFQYDPASRYFEMHEDTLVVSGDNGVPLVRYHIADRGGLISYDDMLRFLMQRDFDATAQIEDARELPFVWVFGRADFTVSYFGANVYPENISVALERDPIPEWVSGKFVLEAIEDAQGDKRLKITVELLPQVRASEELRDRIARSALDELKRLNSEFANYVPPEYQLPKVDLRPAGDAEYFPAGVKHRYTRNPSA